MHDEYLNEKELQALKQVLMEQYDELVALSKEAVSSLTEQREADPDLLDFAVNESDRDFTLRLADRERKLINKIKYALQRIQEGHYGVCESCGEAITFNRLMARPVATLCIDCKTESEQLEQRKWVF